MIAQFIQSLGMYRNGRNYDRPDWDLNPGPLNLQSGAVQTELLGVGG